LDAVDKRMLTFDDFDAWADAIQGGDLRLACDRVEERRWQIAAKVVGDIFLQVAYEGGGNLCYGGNTSNSTLLFLPTTQFGQQLANGEELGEGSLLVIPPGSDFRIAARSRAHSWCSLALPGNATGSRTSAVLHPGAAAGRLRRLVQQLVASPLLAGESTPASAAAHLAAAAADCLVPSMRRQATGRPKADRGEIIRRTMAYLDATSMGRPSIAALAAHADVTERTLCRAFHDTFDISPLDYINLRLLHRVRRSLLAAAPDQTTVSAVLMKHGVWEHGRFAGRYRRQFGDALSETLRRTAREREAG
jgi:AraC family ethanolamine operon transcriptional activator